MWPARHWRNLASQMLDIDGEDLWGPSPGPLLRVQCHLRRRPSDIRSPMRDPHRLSAKSWSPRRAWASRARRAHGGTAKGSAKQLGCPRRDSGVTDGAVLLTSSRPLSRKTSTDRQTWRRLERAIGEARPGANRPQLRSGCLAGRLTTHDKQYCVRISLVHHAYYLLTCMHACILRAPAACTLQIA